MIDPLADLAALRAETDRELRAARPWQRVSGVGAMLANAVSLSALLAGAVAPLTPATRLFVLVAVIGWAAVSALGSVQSGRRTRVAEGLLAERDACLERWRREVLQ
jgi:hypothetical protein